MRVGVDYDLCQGHAMCVAEAPDVFALDDGTDQVRLLLEELPEHMEPAVQLAVKYCPTMALQITD